MSISKLVIASNNKKKRAEIEHILGDLGVLVVPAADTIFVDVVEDADTFAENAQKKAVAFMLANKLPALADDSGLCVDALGGSPGVLSARFSGECATDASNNRKLLADMAGERQRSAYFICALCLVFPDDTPDIISQGRSIGSILEAETGDSGFGYDPLFYSPALGKTFAQSTDQEKVSVSHRGRALRHLQKNIKAIV